jgi:hypothetical protein
MKGYKIRGKTSGKIFVRKTLFRQIHQNYYGLFAPFELMGLVVTLDEEARKKIAAKCRRIGRELKEAMQNPRAP